MLFEIAIVTSSGAAAYVWLTAVMLPLSRGLQSTWHSLSGRGWRCGLPVALGMTAIATIVPAAMLVLLAISAPGLSAQVAGSTSVPFGVFIAVALWSARSVVAGVPRLSVDVELALALAAVTFVSDDAQTLSDLERHYHQNLIARPLPSRFHDPRSPHGVSPRV